MRFPPGPSSRLGRVALSILSLLLALAGVELFFRHLAPQLHEHAEMFVRDGNLGWRFHPNRSGRMRYYREADHVITTNSHGFRDGPFVDLSERKKIFVLGDSFVTNISVPDADVFTEVMENRLENTSVMNLGVNGYGQVQELLLLREMRNAFVPDLVIAVIYLRNDFTDNPGSGWSNRRFPRPSAVLDGDDLRIDPIPPNYVSPPVPIWYGLRRFHLSHFVFSRLGYLKYRFTGSKWFVPTRHTPSEIYLCRKELDPAVKSMYRILELLLLEVETENRKRDVPTLFVLAPSRAQVEDASWDQIVEKYPPSGWQYDRERPNRRLLQFAAEHELMMLDLLPALRAVAQPQQPLYHALEQHWNVAGNRVVAATVLEFMLSTDELQGLVGP